MVRPPVRGILAKARGSTPLPVHYQRSDYDIFWPFGIIGLILIQFENRVPLKPVLGGVDRLHNNTDVNTQLYRVSCFLFFEVFLVSRG